MEPKCREWTDQALTSGSSSCSANQRKDRRVAAILDGLKKRGCPLSREQFVCLMCSQQARGAFNAASGTLTICANNVSSYRQVRDVLSHELIHAYDSSHPDFNPEDPKHHACSEIRAMHLGGDCEMLKEFFRGHFSFSGMFEVFPRSS